MAIVKRCIEIDKIKIAGSVSQHGIWKIVAVGKMKDSNYASIWNKCDMVLSFAVAVKP